MKNSKKIGFELNGVKFEVPAVVLRTTDYWGKPLETPYINLGRKETASVIKQYIQTKYPTLLVWAKSSTFANGNSVDVNVCKPNGEEFDYNDPIFKDIQSFGSSLKGGYYDGMHDIYEYHDNIATTSGTSIECGAKWISINPKAPFGSWPEALSSIKKMMAGEYVWGVLTKEQAVGKLKGYSYTQPTIEKALLYLA